MTERVALICDDRVDRARNWKRQVEAKLGGSWRVETITGGDLATLVEVLSLKELEVRGGAQAPSTEQAEKLALVDAASLVILDSDLSPSPQDLKTLDDRARQSLRNQSGDSIARQVRSYTKAGFVVVVNMFVGRDAPNQTFDLTLMQGLSTHADLHVGAGDLKDSALWAGVAETVNGYCPWHWPALALAHDWVERSTDAIGSLDAPVLTTLGLQADQLTVKQLDPFPGDPSTTSFRDLAKTRLGFKYVEQATDDEAARRMAASVLRRWVSRFLIPSADVVADAPHIITRFPRLLGSDVDQVSAWNALASKEIRGDEILPLAASSLLPELTKFSDRNLYSVSAARRIAATAPSDSVPAEVVFLEDRSAFVPPEESQEFETDVPGTYFRRYVSRKRAKSIAYEPLTRLLT